MVNYNQTYIWQMDKWKAPEIVWDFDLFRLLPLLNEIHYQQGLLLGRLFNIGFDEREQATLLSLTNSIVKSSEIEGEILNVQSVRSSLARRLGIENAALPIFDHSVEGVVEMTLNAVECFDQPLTLERLFSWHAALFPTGYSGMTKIKVAQLRDDKDGAMQVVSGGYGKQKIHYKAPPAEILPQEMARFLNWLNAKQNLDPFIKAGIAHFWFLTLHPFEDGNGRISRAIADYLLAKADQNRQRFYSLSAQIQQQRSAYYEILEATQKGSLEITDWLAWFLNCLIQAMKNAQVTFEKVLLKNKCWQQWNQLPLNERQIKVLNRLLDDFEGNLTNKKYAALTKVSRDTALRDLTDLVEKRILTRSENSGRNVSYQILWVR